LVELKTGEGAVDIDSNRNSRLNPRFSIVLDEEKQAPSPLIIDTSSEGAMTPSGPSNECWMRMTIR
jgi:hypothetical protein